MKKCELLSPAGNMVMLKYAVMYGADAVYLAGTKFGARKFADNFDNESLKEAIDYAHLYGVKVYITINTLIYDEEIKEFLDYVKYIASIGVDAVLVQDFGMLNAIRKVVPFLEIHSSTQMHNNGADMIDLLKSLGVKRVVLDREMNLDEIAKLPKDIEKEVFCHGALCVSYSGQCLYSSLILNRSGNRGECAGLCRLCYKKRCADGSIKSGYFLSLKDLSTIDNIYKILDSRVDCLKIEGRMKSPQYVGYMTKIYREFIDSYYDKKNKVLSLKEKKNIELLFNRGLTKGFINGASNEEMANAESSNHIGIHLGSYKVQNKKVEIKLDDDLVQGDTIRFKEDGRGMTVNFLYDKKDNLINSSNKGEVVYVDNFLELEKSGEVRKVGSILLEKEIDDLPKRKVGVEASITLKKDSIMELTVTDGEHYIKVSKGRVERAQNRPITKEDIERQINKTGGTAYKIDRLNIDLEENVFVCLKALNEIRREALLKMDEARIKRDNVITYDYERISVNSTPCTPELLISVWNSEQYEVAKKYSSLIYSMNEELLKKYDDIRPIYVDSKNIQKVDSIIGDLGSLVRIDNSRDVTTWYMLNALNSESVNSILKYGVRRVVLSLELELDDILKMKDRIDYSKICVFIYGKVSLMKMKYDPLSEKEVLIDRNDKEYNVKRVSKYNFLMSPDALNRIDYVDTLKKQNVGSYMVDFMMEDATEVDKILVNIHKKICKE